MPDLHKILSSVTDCSVQGNITYAMTLSQLGSVFLAVSKQITEL